MSLRDDIGQTIVTYANRRDWDFAEPTAEQTVDRILALVYEAVMSEEALDAGIDTWHRDMNTSGINGGELAIDTIQAALAAAGIVEATS